MAGTRAGSRQSGFGVLLLCTAALSLAAVAVASGQTIIYSRGQNVAPADFGDGEIVWTVTAHGKTGSAYGSLRVDYVVDGLMKMMDIGGLGVTDVERRNQPPVVAIEGDARRMVRVGEPLDLSATASDDSFNDQTWFDRG